MLGGILLLSHLNVFAQVIYVDASAAGANNGSSWTDAYNSLQSALAIAASGDEIWVADGVYKPSQAIDIDGINGAEAREKTFQVPAGVALYGGFAGGEVSLAARNPALYPCILSGDLDNNDLNLDANFIAESPDDIIGNNAYHVLYLPNATASTRIDGFIITAGKANKGSSAFSRNFNQDGGACFIAAKSPTYQSQPGIYHCMFQGNYAASDGAALATSQDTTGLNFDIRPTLQSCKFIHNQSAFNGGAIFTGSFLAGQYAPVISGCEFIENEALRNGGAIYLIGDAAQINQSTFTGNQVTVISEDMSTRPGSGGAVRGVSSKATFQECHFLNNSATGNPTGVMEGGGGGAVYFSANESSTNTLGASTIKFTNCGFYNNSTGGNGGGWGGAALHLIDGGVLTAFYTNCVFSGNSAQNEGGAVAGYSRNLGSPGFIPQLSTFLTNCTFALNNASIRGGAAVFDEVFEADNIGLIENAILWDNSAPANAEIYNSGAILTISSSLVEGSGGSGGAWVVALGTDGGGNLGQNPLFVNVGNALGADALPGTNDDGLRLQNASPALNAGNNAAVGLLGISTDFAGEDRIQDAQVDMGAYERAETPVVENLAILSPLQDAYLQGATRFNNQLVRVEKNRRTGYLQFDLSELTGTITSAKLQLTVDSDPGNGQIKVFKGNSNAWTELNLSLGNRPLPGAELASLTGSFSLHQTYTWELDATQISTGGPLSLILEHLSGNDVAFASKENPHAPAPKLILTVLGEVPSCTDIAVTKFMLVNANTNALIRELHDGDVIDKFIDPAYNIVALTEDCNGKKVESVVFRRNGNLFRVENIAPYAMGGDIEGNYNLLNLPLGLQTIRATPYTLDKGKGEKGTSHEIQITVVQGGARPLPEAISLNSQDNSGFLGLTVFPNPVQETLHVRYSHPDAGSVVLRITDLLGREVYREVREKKQIAFEAALPINSLKKGLYLLAVQQGKWHWISRLMVNPE
ncbi:MAG: hypothetical protein OHK0053_30210 [Microscillaceae bacterium]